METHADVLEASLADSAEINVEFPCAHHRWVEGFVSSDAALTAKLQVPKPATSPSSDSDWLTIESESVVADTPLPFTLRLPIVSRARIRLENASGSTATVDYRVSSKGGE